MKWKEAAGMLNLLRVDLLKLWRSRTVWIVACAFVVCILSVFIPLSYGPDFQTFTENLMDNQNVFSAQDAQDLLMGVEEAQDALDLENLREKFTQGFYSYFNGIFIIIAVGATIVIIADSMRGTMQNAILCGYSRNQIYTSKLVSALVWGVCMLVMTALLDVFLGSVFYGNALGGETVRVLLPILGVQCVALLEITAVTVALALYCKNAWAVLVNVGLFTAIPSIPMLIHLGTGSEAARSIFRGMPSYLSTGYYDPLMSLEHMAARPDLWDGRFLLTAGVICAVVTVGSTLLGMWAFRRRDL